MDNDYVKIQKAYRAQFLQLQKQLEKEYGLIATELNAKIKALIDRNTVKGLIVNLEVVKDEINQTIRWFTVVNTKWLDTNINKSIGIAITGQDAAAQYYITNLVSQNKPGADLLRGFLTGKIPLLSTQTYGSGLNKAVRDLVWSKRWQDGFQLSDRVWTLDQIARKSLNSMIEQAVNSGMSAVDFSRAVETYLTETGPKWTTAIKPALTDRGTIKYNALRLARTETNQAYHKAQNMTSEGSVITKGLKWNLSASHPKKDICDQWATHDLFGLGAGVYKVGQTPIDHPNGLCFLTDVLYQGAELINRIKKKYNVA
jgi:hypothetical protein